MQVNGIGSSHVTEHQVTNCTHSHSDGKKIGAPASGLRDTVSLQQDVKPQTLEQVNGNFSLTDWLKNVLQGGRRWFRDFWSTGAAEEAGVKDAGLTAQRTALYAEEAVLSSEKEGLQAADKLQNQALAGNLQQNPYFSAVREEKRESEKLWQKIRVRFRDISGYLAKHFSGRNAFQAKPEQQKEDLRRHSRYRQDDMEINCIITDDSYLLDSYDRNGEYSRLASGKRTAAGGKSHEV